MIYEVRSISFAYPTGGNVLQNVDLQVRQGDVISLLGRNGAGKSTLLGCMLGLLKPQQGEILLEGTPLQKLGERGIARRVGFVPQNHVPSFGYTVLDFVQMGCASRLGLFSRPGREERKLAEHALQQMGIEHIAEKPYTEISGGQRQQATIARAIVSRPMAILFDEPTAHLDFSNQLTTLRMIKQLSAQGFAIVITTHNPDHTLLLGGQAALLDKHGSLTVGDVEQTITQENLRRVFETDIRLEYIEALGRKACVYPNL